MKLETDDDCLVLIAAFRYSLGRNTYMPSVIREKLMEAWSFLPESDKKLIKKEIKEAIDRNAAGSKYEVKEWKGLLNWSD